MRASTPQSAPLMRMDLRGGGLAVGLVTVRVHTREVLADFFPSIPKYSMQQI